MPAASSGVFRSACTRIALAAFGGLFLIAFLAVPVTTSETVVRQDPGSPLVFRTTYPKNATMFLPSYLAAKGRAQVRVRSAQWLGTMAIIIVLGVFDSLVLCRVWRRRRTHEPDEGTDADGPGSPRP